MRADKEVKVNSWRNLETLACTDVGQPGVLYRRSVHNTGRNPNAGGPPYGERNGMF